MSWQRSRGIHAARPTPHRLRSACTQVAICGVWAIASEDQKLNQEPEICTLFLQSGLPAVAISRTPPPASRTAGDLRQIHNRRSLLILIFMHARPDAAKRDLGAGRTQVALRGSSGMDAARAAPRHGWRMAAGPRSVAGVREARRRRAQARSKHPWLLGVLFQVTRRRRNASAVRQNPPKGRNRYQPHHKKRICTLNPTLKYQKPVQTRRAVQHSCSFLISRL